MILNFGHCHFFALFPLTYCYGLSSEAFEMGTLPYWWLSYSGKVAWKYLSIWLISTSRQQVLRGESLEGVFHFFTRPDITVAWWYSHRFFLTRDVAPWFHEMCSEAISICLLTIFPLPTEIKLEDNECHNGRPHSVKIISFLFKATEVIRLKLRQKCESHGSRRRIHDDWENEVVLYIQWEIVFFDWETSLFRVFFSPKIFFLVNFFNIYHQ